MPFGLTGAPGSFQRLMNKIFRGLPFVTTYIDDVLIQSINREMHKTQVFQRIKEAGLTLKGCKCHIGKDEVIYLGHVFFANGMRPDEKKIAAMKDWPTPKDATEVCQFLGLASYYRRYVLKFAEIACPLNNLMQKGIPFLRSSDCEQAFLSLKEKLIQAPVLAYPKLGASTFTLETDASAVGIRAVLEQDGHPVAYVSQALKKAEKNYSVIQQECLAIVFATKQFRHYLLGRPFTILTNVAPLQW